MTMECKDSVQDFEQPSKTLEDDEKRDDRFVPLEEIPPPPDGGWGWVVTFASFMCNLIIDGIAYTFGILLNPLVEDFGSNRSTISWVGSLLAGFYLTSGPIVGALVNKFGCRTVCIGGSIVASLGIGLSIFSPNVTILMITYGVIGGFGMGLIYLPAIVAVGYYFEQKRALATGLSVCGSGVGTFLFAPFATFLLDNFGWKGANLIFSALCLNCAVFGALMRPLELNTRTTESRQEIVVEQEDEDTFDIQSGMQMIDFPRSDSSLSSFSRKLSSGEGTHPITIKPVLPPLAEETVTSQQREEHRPITDLFPDAQIKPLVAPPPRRSRTTSDSVAVQSGRRGRFQSITIVDEAQSSDNKSNQISRNVSSPLFGQMVRVSTSEKDGFQDQIVFGIISNDQSTPNFVLQPRRNSRRLSRPIVRPFYRKDVLYAGSINNLMSDGEETIPRPGTFVSVASQATLSGYRHSVISIPKFSIHPVESSAGLSLHRGSIVASHLSIPRDFRLGSLSEKDGDIETKRSVWEALKEMSNFNLLVNKYFMLIAISNVFGMLGFYVPFVYLPNMAVLKGVSVQNANFLLSVIGISNTIGRVGAGWFSDFPWVNSLFVTNIAIFMSGVTVMVIPFCDSYESFVVTALFFGLFVAAYISLTSIVLVDLLGLDNLTSAFGLLVLFRGLSSIVGPPVAGSVYDLTQSYDAAFYLAGGALIISALISFGVQVLQRQSASRN